MKYVSDKLDIPQHKHFAAIIFSSIFIPGDERSRTNPGHGYPERYDTKIEYIVFADEDDMGKWVAMEETSQYSRHDYVIIEAEGLKLVRSMQVKIQR